MKKWTKKFIKELPKHRGRIVPSNAVDNAESAEKNIHFPKDLWLELSEKKITKHYKHLDPVSAFMAGVAVGWVEKNN